MLFVAFAEPQFRAEPIQEPFYRSNWIATTHPDYSRNYCPTRTHCPGQLQPFILSLISVTAPVLARSLPVSVTPVGPGLLSEIDVVARMFPSKVGPFRVAELPTCQKTLQGLPMLVMTTVLRGFVVNDDAIWKIQTAFGLPCPSRVRTPV